MGPDDPFPGDKVGQPVTVVRHLGARRHGLRLRPRARRRRRLLGGDAAGDRRRRRPGAPGRARLDADARRGARRPHRHRRAGRLAPAPRGHRRAPTTTRPTTYSRSCGSPTCSSTSTRTSTAPTPSRRQPEARASTAGRPSSSCRRPAGSPRCATCSTRSSGGSSARFAVFIWWRCVTRHAGRGAGRGRRTSPVRGRSRDVKPVQRLPRARPRRRRAARLLRARGASR